MRRLLTVAAFAALLAPAAASAKDPIMPLSDVRAGMHCTALSVVKGTAITQFNADVIDVVDPQRVDSARILVRVSGPAVDATGAGEGFSGSPIYCAGADGVSRNIGAISESVADYGNFVLLVRPIEAILSAPVVPPTQPARAVRGARDLAGPLTISGVSPRLGAALSSAARKAGRVLIASPATRGIAYPPQPMVPGAAIAVGMTSGDIQIGAGGTVAYTDGNDVWAFGHEFEGSGRRALFLQDAYVYDVVNNPVNAGELTTYKLLSPGNDLGAITGDAVTAVTGRVGAPPPSYPLRITVRDLDTHAIRSSLTKVADEADVGRPSGIGVLGLAITSGIAEDVTTLLNGAPARQSGDMCVTVRLREVTKPARFCNNYTVDGEGPNFLAGALISDAGTVASYLDAYRFGALHPTGIDIGIRVRRGVRQAYLRGAGVRGKARRGRTVSVRLRLRQLSDGKLITRTVKVRIPRSLRPGTRTLRLRGVGGDSGNDPFEGGAFTIVFGDEAAGSDDSGQADQGPEDPEEIAAAIADLHRDDGLTAVIGRSTQTVFRSSGLRISGSASVRVRIRR